jgi:hypothetical protein
LVKKPLGKQPLVRPRSRWVFNIKKALKEGRKLWGPEVEMTKDGGPWQALVIAVLKSSRGILM